MRSILFKIIWVIIIVVIGVFAFMYARIYSLSVEDKVKDVVRKDFTKEELIYFSEIGFGSNCSRSDDMLSRWERKQITLSIFGHPKVNELKFLKKAVDTLNLLMEKNQLVIVKSNLLKADIKIYFLSMEELIDKFPKKSNILSIGGMVEPRKGYFRELRECTIHINMGLTKEQARKHVILEELTQSLGIINDSDKYSNSIFYDPYSLDTVLAPIDKKLIRLMYNYDLPVGLKRKSFLKTFAIQFDELKILNCN